MELLVLISYSKRYTMVVITLSILAILTVAANAQNMNNGFFQPGFRFPAFPPNFPFGDMGFPKMPEPWYEGQNVCKEEKTLPESDEMSGFLEDFGGSSDFSSNSQSCKGNNNIYVCTSRSDRNGVTEVRAIKYKCCPGFVRPRDGSPGCVQM